MYCAPTATAAAAAAAFSSEEFADDDNFDAADVPAFSYEHGGDDMSVDQVRAAADRLCACVPVCLSVRLSVRWRCSFCTPPLKTVRTFPPNRPTSTLPQSLSTCPQCKAGAFRMTRAQAMTTGLSASTRCMSRGALESPCARC
jgi:hypothetical protein